MIIAASVAGIAILAAAAVFGYKVFLESMRDSKAAELTAAEEAIDTDMVEEFVRLRNRLLAADTLLDQHVRISAFFDVLETRTLQTVRFDSLSISVNEDRTAEIEMEGIARSFNALAAQSTEFAAEKRIKRAIFSGISVNENNTVSFTLNAELDPRLITGILVSAEAPSAVMPVVEPVQTVPVGTTTTP